jgi:predicted transcriptional regulator
MNETNLLTNRERLNYQKQKILEFLYNEGTSKTISEIKGYIEYLNIVSEQDIESAIEELKIEDLVDQKGDQIQITEKGRELYSHNKGLIKDYIKQATPQIIKKVFSILLK